MSIKDRLAKKTQDLVVPVKGEVTTSIASPMRTGPGQMLMVNSLMRESNEKVALLEERLKKFEGGLPVLLLNPQEVTASKWANRAKESFSSAAFEELKIEIANAGGNVQPIKVRPVQGSSGQFEIIYGHRRHRACADLGLPVLALVEDLSDADLFKQMDRENRARADLSPWEQGMMYRNALNEKLFASREQLARELGIDPGNLSKALKLADLDEAVVKVFKTPLDLQFRWAKPLGDAWLHDRVRMQAVVRELSSAAAGQSAKYLFDRLIGAVMPEVRVEHVRVGKRVVAEIHVDGDRVTVRFGNGTLDEAGVSRLRDLIVATVSV